jgi:CheY-like chemotaxis protein
VRSTILLAEDDPRLRRLIAMELESAGYAVEEASNGGELIDYICNAVLHSERRPLPALIVTDVEMPVLGGLEALYGLRRARLGIDVIVITGHASPSVLARAKSLGALRVLEKPFDLDALVAEINARTGGPGSVEVQRCN